MHPIERVKLILVHETSDEIIGFFIIGCEFGQPETFIHWFQFSLVCNLHCIQEFFALNS